MHVSEVSCGKASGNNQHRPSSPSRLPHPAPSTSVSTSGHAAATARAVFRQTWQFSHNVRSAGMQTTRRTRERRYPFDHAKPSGCTGPRAEASTRSSWSVRRWRPSTDRTPRYWSRSHCASSRASSPPRCRHRRGTELNCWLHSADTALWSQPRAETGSGASAPRRSPQKICSASAPLAVTAPSARSSDRTTRPAFGTWRKKPRMEKMRMSSRSPAGDANRAAAETRPSTPGSPWPSVSTKGSVPLEMCTSWTELYPMAASLRHVNSRGMWSPRRGPPTHPKMQPTTNRSTSSGRSRRPTSACAQSGSPAIEAPAPSGSAGRPSVSPSIGEPVSRVCLCNSPPPLSTSDRPGDPTAAVRRQAGVPLPEAPPPGSKPPRACQRWQSAGKYTTRPVCAAATTGNLEGLTTAARGLLPLRRQAEETVESAARQGKRSPQTTTDRSCGDDHRLGDPSACAGAAGSRSSMYHSCGLQAVVARAGSRTNGTVLAASTITTGHRRSGPNPPHNYLAIARAARASGTPLEWPSLGGTRSPRSPLNRELVVMRIRAIATMDTCIRT